MTFLLKVSRLIDRVTGAIGALVGWAVLAMILIGAYNALVRYLDAQQVLDTRLSSNAFIELQWYLFSVVFLLGAGYALKQGAHVRVDLLYNRLGPRARAWIDIVGTVVFLIPFAVFVFWESLPAIENSWAVREVSPDPGGLPRYPIKAVIPIAIVLLVVQALSELIKRVATVTGANDLADGDDPSGTDGHAAAAPEEAAASEEAGTR
ncbi:TRAP transporter small permease subunit [Haliangium sp.]|uniref:TRAP transporter small permease subunit n=1 Tax=Haliangium sp. TaxID=2663208 RepID=UPI003D0FC7DE